MLCQLECFPCRIKLDLQGLVGLAILKLVDFAVANVVVRISERANTRFCNIAPGLLVLPRAVQVQGCRQCDLDIITCVEGEKLSVDVELEAGGAVEGAGCDARGSVVLLVVDGTDGELVLEEERVTGCFGHFIEECEGLICGEFGVVGRGGRESA